MEKLGENCMAYGGRNHNITETHAHEEGIAMKLTIDITPGFLCWFESFADFQILPDDHEGEGDFLSIYYFPY